MCLSKKKNIMIFLVDFFKPPNIKPSTGRAIECTIDPLIG